MYRISDFDYDSVIKPVLDKVFASTDPYTEAFFPIIPARKIIYPVDNCPERYLLESLIQAASEEGDTGCYLTLDSQFEGEPGHCYIPFTELIDGFASPSLGKGVAERLNMTIIPEFIFLSEQGKWGLTVSYELHGILGGSHKFIQTFSKHIPDIDNQVYEFLKDMQYSQNNKPLKNLDWLLPMLSHVYGQEHAVTMIEKVQKEFDLLKM